MGELGDIQAVAFDIDGTLYETWKFNTRIVFHFLAHSHFFLHYGLVRSALRKDKAEGDFPRIQAEYMARRLRTTPEKAQEALDKIVYQGLKKYFIKITPCENAVDCVIRLKEKGIKVAILSDFPPEQKGELWGIKNLADLSMGTEECGALKPNPMAFEIMAKKLGIKPENILYVGNSYKYDVAGSKAAGMKSAWFTSKRKAKKKKDINNELADIRFSNYADLMQVLGLN